MGDDVFPLYSVSGHESFDLFALGKAVAGAVKVVSAIAILVCGVTQFVGPGIHHDRSCR